MTGPTADPASAGRRQHRSWALLAGVVLLVAGVGTYLVASRARLATSSASQPAAATNGSLAPNGTFTTTTGAPATIASLRGKPTLVWFVAAGCASCAASIPTIAQNMRQLQSNGVEVVTLGLYGAFPTGKQGIAQLLSFGRAAAGTSIERPGWTWGTASEALSAAYDPSGTPDVYALINADGYVIYRNSVPVSTMPQLLAATGALSGHTGTAGQPSAPTTTTSSTLP
ncbi:MAG: peroxiredoxin family protein [Acidimicrobiales bacterium]